MVSRGTCRHKTHSGVRGPRLAPMAGPPRPAGFSRFILLEPVRRGQPIDHQRHGIDRLIQTPGPSSALQPHATSRQSTRVRSASMQAVCRRRADRTGSAPTIQRYRVLSARLRERDPELGRSPLSWWYCTSPVRSAGTGFYRNDDPDGSCSLYRTLEGPSRYHADGLHRLLRPPLTLCRHSNGWVLPATVAPACMAIGQPIRRLAPPVTPDPGQRWLAVHHHQQAPGHTVRAGSISGHRQQVFQGRVLPGHGGLLWLVAVGSHDGRVPPDHLLSQGSECLGRRWTAAPFVPEGTGTRSGSVSARLRRQGTARCRLPGPGRPHPGERTRCRGRRPAHAVQGVHGMAGARRPRPACHGRRRPRRGRGTVLCRAGSSPGTPMGHRAPSGGRPIGPAQGLKPDGMDWARGRPIPGERTGQKLIGNAGLRTRFRRSGASRRKNRWVSS